MTGNSNVIDTSKAQIIRALEETLEKAKKGELEFICMVYQAGQDIQGLWRGIDTAQKTMDACNGLNAVRQSIIDKKLGG